MNDLIRRRDAIEAMHRIQEDDIERYGCCSIGFKSKPAVEALEALPSAEPDNQVHLCGFCKYGYPECPAEMSDIIFGNGKGHDNVCACAKFEIKPERTAKVECIAEVYRGEIVDHYLSGVCEICGESTYDHAKYCSECGAKLDWSEKGNK